MYRPEAASTKEVSLLISIACLNALSNDLMFEFFFAIFLSNLSLAFCGSFLAYSMMMVLLYRQLGNSLNATLWIASYLWLNVTKGSVGDICMLCSCVVASVVLGMSE